MPKLNQRKIQLRLSCSKEIKDLFLVDWVIWWSVRVKISSSMDRKRTSAWLETGLATDIEIDSETEPTWFEFFSMFFLSAAIGQGITWVVLVVLLNLVHFLFKRNLSKKNIPDGIVPGSFSSTAKHLFTELQSHRYYQCENWFLYLAQTLDQYWLTLVFSRQTFLKFSLKQRSLPVYFNSKDFFM